MRDAWQRLGPDLLEQVRDRLDPAEALAFAARLEQHWDDVVEPLTLLYGKDDELLRRLVTVALDCARARPAGLRELDRRREIDPGWYQRERQLGYVCYVDRFSGTLSRVPEHLDPLTELGVTYLHLMPLLEPRPGENDGGYAVVDYDAVDPRVGTMADLEALATVLRGRGISLCLDLVVNHTAQEHPWARAWLAGDPEFADFYTAFPDRAGPDAFEATLPEVFPDRAPGSFTWFPEALGGAGGWVWTSFFSYQWDLNWANPNVFVAMLATIGRLANRGVEVLRLDAVPFLWKRLGTNSQNLPEVHMILQALHALTRLCCPATIFKAEAIVSPDELVPYLGGHERYRPECELAYHNQLMVMLWSSLATKDARLATQSLARMRPIPAPGSWVTYVRCHDDIGWAVSDEDAAAVGWDAASHRRFLNDFYSGRFAGSFARGELFQANPETGDARISGSAASLCGLEAATTPDERERAERRLVLLYSVVYAFGGTPLVYMGDEVAQLNDRGFGDDPTLADDNRWLHRPFLDHAALTHRHDPGTTEGRIFGALARLGKVRAATPALRAGGESDVLDVGVGRVLACLRRHPRSGAFVGVANVGEEPVVLDLGHLRAVARIAHGRPLALSAASDDGMLNSERLTLPALGWAWLGES